MNFETTDRDFNSETYSYLDTATETQTEVIDGSSSDQIHLSIEKRTSSGVEIISDGAFETLKDHNGNYQNDQNPIDGSDVKFVFPDFENQIMIWFTNN